MTLELKSGSLGIQICLRNAKLHMEEKVNGNKRFSIPAEEWRKSSALRRSVLNKAISGGCELTLGMSSLQMCMSLCLCTSLHAQLFVVHKQTSAPVADIKPSLDPASSLSITAKTFATEEPWMTILLFSCAALGTMALLLL